MFLAGVGDQALSSAGFAMLGMSSGCRQPVRHPARGSRRPAGTLDVPAWRVDRPLGGGLARRPTLRISPRTKRHRTSLGVAQSSGPARPRPVRHVGSSTGFSGAARSKIGMTGIMAGPGEAGWNPVDAHTRRPSWRSPFDPIEGDAPRRGELLVLGGRAGIPAIPEADPVVSVEPHALPGRKDRRRRDGAR